MLSCQKHLFSLPEDITYLNCAYMSPMLKSVESAGIQGIQAKRNPTGVSPSDFFDPLNQVREAFSKLIDNPDPTRICLIPSASYGMGIVAKNLPLEAGDKIIVVGDQFPSNVYPWMSLEKEHAIRVIGIPAPQSPSNRGKIWNEAILDAIDSRTRMVTLGHIHWADGTIFDLRAIRERTREVGALLVLDGTQSIGALPFSVQAFQPDALIVAGYKCMMGPYSIGCAYLGPYFDNGSPIEENWKNRKDSHIFSRLVDYQPEYQPGALRYDVGESSNFILVPMLLEAIKQVLSWEPWKIQSYCKQITQAPLEALKSQGWEVEDSSQRTSHLFGIRPPKGLDLVALKSLLEEKRVFVSVRGDAIRVSPSVYNTEADLFRLVEACKEVSTKEKVR